MLFAWMFMFYMELGQFRMDYIVTAHCTPLCKKSNCVLRGVLARLDEVEVLRGYKGILMKSRGLKSGFFHTMDHTSVNKREGGESGWR